MDLARFSKVSEPAARRLRELYSVKCGLLDAVPLQDYVWGEPIDSGQRVDTVDAWHYAFRLDIRKATHGNRKFLIIQSGGDLCPQVFNPLQRKTLL
jgi:hypothetical protein